MAIRNPTAPTAAQSEVPAVIAGNVPLVRLSEALARAGLIGRHDADRGVLVIELVQSQPVAVRRLIPQDAELGITWYNRLSKAERLHWHRVAASAVPADAWRAFQSGATLPD
jgi:hypothetical protein